MLKELKVRNFAIIDDLSVSFGPGLNVLTGETGAGKSIIVGALGIALGQRAYSEMIKTGAPEAVVEAYFLCDSGIFAPLIEKLGITLSDGIIVRRNISASGKTRAFINDTMAGVQSLAELGRLLVDMSGQHEHQSLLAPENQMMLLDRFGKLDDKRARVEAAFSETQALGKRIEDLTRSLRDRAQRLDFLKFQINEIDSLSLEPGEDIKLEEEKAILGNLSRLREAVEHAYGLLYGSDGSSIEKLSSAASRLREASSIDKNLAETLGSLEAALPLIEDASASPRSSKDRYSADPERLAWVEDRLDAIRGLKNKYGDSIEAIIKYKAGAAEEMEAIETSDELLSELKDELDGKDAALKKIASELSEKRIRAARGAASSIKAVLGELAMEKSDFKIDVRAVPVSAAGADGVEFLFSANPGEALKPLAKVASGGELSRIMLAIKGVLREADNIPVLIFDEVDAGIGGKTAVNVAGKLKELASLRQVICITHLPQIASLADSHFLIEKGEAKNKVSVKVRKLAGKERQEEIARMLSGKVTETSLKHAKEIMGAKGRTKSLFAGTES